MLDQDLGDLDGVGGGALAQVVAGDPEVEGALVARVAADAADEDVVLARGRRSPVGYSPAPGSSTTCTPVASASRARQSSGERSSRVCRLIDSEWPTKTGTRAQVAEIPTSSPKPRILRVSAITLRSSVV